MKKVGCIACLFLSQACVGSLEEARDSGESQPPANYDQQPQTIPPQEIQMARPNDVECHSLDTQRRNWSAAAKGGVFLAGGAGLSEIPLGDDKTARSIGIAGIVVSGLVAVVSQVEADGTTESWARECAGP